MPEIGGHFPGENRRNLERLMAEHQIQSVIEIGTFLGLSACFFAQRVEHVICIDPFEERRPGPPGPNNVWYAIQVYGTPNPYYDAFRVNMMQAGVWDRIVPVCGLSWEVVDRVAMADLVYIDGDHTYENCRRDIELYLPKARKIICGDDYKHEGDFGVIEAVNDLLSNHEHDGPFWWYIK